MFTTARAKTTNLAVSALVLFALAGCSASAPHATVAAGQSKAAACKKLSSSMKTVAQGLSSSYAALLSDPTAAEKKLTDLTDQFTASTAKVTNPAVQKAATAADQALVGFNTDVKAALADPKTADVAALQKDATTVQSTFTDLGKACS